MKERTYTFTTGFKDGKPTGETYTLKESELDAKHIDLLTGELMLKFQDSPQEVQRRFLSSTKYKK